MITSAAREQWPGDIAIADLDRAGLPGASVVRTTKIATLAASAGRLIGRLADDQVDEVVSAIIRNMVASVPVPPR